MNLIETEVTLHRKFKFLAEPHPFKILYGGRDGMKSWGIAQQLVINLAQRNLRWLCARETQKSMKDSVHKLISDTIMRLNVGDRFKITEESIVGRNGTKDTPPSEFLFAGIKEAKNIKSYESCDGCWVEEAQVVSKKSWEIILPTIRKAGSEIWISFNPELSTDETYKRWVLSPPPGAVVVKVGWEDNLWLSEESRVKIEHLKSTDLKAFEHIYGGNAISEIAGAIFKDELRKADEQGHVGSVPYDPTKPVDTAWDLGFGDPTCIWFVQARGGLLCFIDYLSSHHETIADYVIELQQRKYMYGTDWLPWDAISNINHRRLIGSGDQSNTIPQLMRAAGRKVDQSPMLLKPDALNAARTIFPLCRFDAVKCAEGLQGLRHYQWDRTAAEPGKRKPLHDWASHPSEAFLTAAVSIRRERHEPAYAPSRPVKAEVVI